MTENNNLEKEYEIFRKSERIAKEKKEYSHYGLGYAWRNHRPEFTEKEKKEFEQKILQYDEEIANIIKDLKVLRKKLENNTDTTPANIEHLNQEIKALGNRCKELYDKEGFRKPRGGVFKDSFGGVTHWDDFGDDGGWVTSDYRFQDSNPKLHAYWKKYPNKYKEMYIGNREFFWLRKPIASKITSIIDEIKFFFTTKSQSTDKMFKHFFGKIHKTSRSGKKKTRFG